MVDIGAERARLLKLDADWAALASEGRDVDGMLSFWTDDAVVIAPGLPIVAGKSALRNYVESSLRIPGFKVSWTSDEVTLSADGTMAYIFSKNSVTMNNADGKPVTTEGRAVTIWRRESDSQWKCAVDIWN